MYFIRLDNMPLIPSDECSFSDVSVALNYSATSARSLNDSRVRGVAGIATGAISVSDLRGKTYSVGDVLTVDVSIVQIAGNTNYTVLGTADTILEGQTISVDLYVGPDGGSLVYRRRCGSRYRLLRVYRY